MTPRVLLVSHSPHLYGAERSLLDLARGLRDRGRYVPGVLVPRPGPLADALRAAGVPYHVERSYHWIGQRHRLARAPVSLALNLRALRRVRGAVRELGPALVYSNTLATPFGAVIARREGLPHVWHARELVGRGVRERFDFGLARSLRFVQRRSACIVCNSRAVRARLAETIPDAPFEVVHNGLRFAEPAPDPTGHHRRTVAGVAAPRLLIVGAVYAGKGHEDALRALAALRTRGQAATLQVVGSGPDAELAGLRTLAHSLGVQDHVQWIGYIEDPAQHRQDAAVALVCSRSEAFGRAAVEAMAHGVPTVATAIDGLREVVEDGTTGLCYQPGDVAALTEAVERLLREPELHDRLAADGQRSVRDRFTLDAHLDAIEAVFARVLQPGGYQASSET